MQTSPRAFSQVEVTLALGIASFCFVVLFGLVPVGLHSNQTSLAQTGAASVAASVIADLRATPVSATAAVPSPRFGIPVEVAPGDPAAGTMHTTYLRGDGTVAIASPNAPAAAVDQNADLTQSPIYRVTLSFFPPANAMAAQRLATSVRVLVTWPAAADPVAGTYPCQYNGSFETVFSLDRN